MDIDMKKFILVIALGLIFGTSSAFDYDYRNDEHTAYVNGNRRRLDARIERLNRITARVRSEVSGYRCDWRLRREVQRISSEVSRVNWRYRRGFVRFFFFKQKTAYEITR